MASDPGPARSQPTGHPDALRAHGYHKLPVKDVRRETADAKSFVIDVPVGLRDDFAYRAGQFCTFRVRIGTSEYIRSYSMSSAPETDAELAVTVKSVPGGTVSNWFLDHVSAGDAIELTRPAGVFCLGPGEAPVMAFCGGSGVTPVISLAKSALASTTRPVEIVYANRDADSVIFERALRQLASAHPGRLVVHHHLDSQSGFLDAAAVEAFVAGRGAADFYICGPSPFMDLVEHTLLAAGVTPEQIFIERFSVPGPAAPETPGPVTPAGPGPLTPVPAEITVVMKGRKTRIPYQRGDTVLETARRGALQPPFSCESGTCATCMALIRKGAAAMRVNNALTPEEVDEGWVLTCQALPEGDELTIEYEAM